MSENLDTHFNGADAARKTLPSREALMEDVLKRILCQCRRQNDNFYLSTQSAKKLNKAEYADQAQRFFIKWHLSINKAACTDNVNSWNFYKLAHRATHPEFRWYVLEEAGGPVLDRIPFTYITDLGNALEIMTEKADSAPLNLDGELLWGILITGIDAGRIIARHQKENLGKASSEQAITIKALKNISETIDFFGSRFAGLDQKTIAALKDEMLNPVPFEKDKMVDIVKSARSNLSGELIAQHGAWLKTQRGR